MLNNTTAREKLNSIVQQGAASAERVVRQVYEEVPQDRIVRATAMDFSVENGNLTVLPKALDASRMRIHEHCIPQVAERAGIPFGYLRELVRGEESWQPQLAEHALRQHFTNQQKSKYLIRSVDQTVRGFLSDRFRRLDSRPILDALIKGFQEYGVVPVSGHALDTRVTLRALVPQVFEVVPGEWVAYGADWSNSDYGFGTNSLSGFILRLICLNGAVAASMLKQVHLGRRLDENIEFSTETYRLDTEATVSATRDVTKLLFSAETREALFDRVRKSAEEQPDAWSRNTRRFASRLSRAELEEAKKAFDGPDVINLPAGKSAWRVSNALSWIAKTATDPVRQLELERLAGEVALPVAA